MIQNALFAFKATLVAFLVFKYFNPSTSLVKATVSPSVNQSNTIRNNNRIRTNHSRNTSTRQRIQNKNHDNNGSKNRRKGTGIPFVTNDDSDAAFSETYSEPVPRDVEEFVTMIWG